MKKVKISIIAAIGKNRELGKDNRLIWHISEDLKRFKKLTQGHAVIMGRKTFESIGRPLPNRINIVVTRDKTFRAEGCVVVNSLGAAFAKASASRREIFIIGGGQIYQQAMKYADKLYLTVVDSTAAADTFFPDYSQFKKIVFEKKGETGDFRFTWLELIK